MAFLKGKNYQIIMNANDETAKEIREMLLDGETKQEDLDKKVDEWHSKNGEGRKNKVFSFQRGSNNLSDWGKKNDNLYHGTYRGNKESIEKNGFKEGQDLFVSNSIYDAEGYGDTIFELPIKLLDEMEIIEVDDEKWEKNEPVDDGVDGYSHSYKGSDVVNYRIKNVGKLNKIIEFLEDLKNGNKD